MGTPLPKRAVAAWLLACCGFVLAVLVTGGVTRLTHSGLSIVEWRPVTGTLPPLSRASWEAEFEKYKGTPEWLQLNADMRLEGFKAIYLMEYLHRLLARLAGLAFVVPLLFLAAAGRLDRALVPRLAVIALLWALQGALGWFMVASGLVSIPRVSPYRLTAHLLAACLLFASMLWTALELLRPAAAGAEPRRTWGATALLVLAAVAIASGGLVAGLKAGYLYNTFPKMMGYWVPPLLLELEPWVRNFFENELAVQFEHRILAALLLAATLAVWWRSRRLGGRARLALNLLLVAVALQVALGILTLLWHMPLSLAVAHQANALAVLGALLYARRELRSA